jgi:hypothetical protein
VMGWGMCVGMSVLCWGLSSSSLPLSLPLSDFIVVSAPRLLFLVFCPASDFHSSSYHRPTYQVEYPVPASIVLVVSGGRVVGESEVSECVLEPPCFTDIFEQVFYPFWVCKKDREGL